MSAEAETLSLAADVTAPEESDALAAIPGTLTASCEDCMALMARYPDKHFDLAIVDVPYGIEFSDYERGSSGEEVRKRYTKTGKKQWDSSPPPSAYFVELRRVSRNQIIFGAIHFWSGNLGNTPHFIFWDKAQPVKNFAAGELVWTSFTRPAAICRLPYYGNIGSEGDNRFHPTQKPVALYRWLLANYAEPGQRILDTHMGSGSIAIASHYFGAHLTACEIDAEYFAAAMERIKRETAQTTLFT